MSSHRPNTRQRRANMDYCTQLSTDGVFCPNMSSTTYNGVRMCFVHLHTAKANEDCPVCYTKMTTTTCTRLPCGHYFHTGCLSQWARPSCPMCRSTIPTDTSISICMEARIRPLMARIFNEVPHHDITRTFNIMNNIVDICAAGMSTTIDAMISLPPQSPQPPPPPPPQQPQSPPQPPESPFFIPQSLTMRTRVRRETQDVEDPRSPPPPHSPPSPSGIFLPFMGAVYNLPIPVPVPITQVPQV